MTETRIVYDPRRAVWLVMLGAACVYGPTTPERCAQYIARWGRGWRRTAGRFLPPDDAGTSSTLDAGTSRRTSAADERGAS